ncbi:MAG: transposase [Prevotella sp.]|nr:transposase [Prevotella sp.]
MGERTDIKSAPTAAQTARPIGRNIPTLLLVKFMEKDLPQRKKMRMEGYDYSSCAHYFVTIVVQDRICLFGEVVDEEMVLNEAGKAIDSALSGLQTRHHGCQVPIHVVMPNHIHFIFTNLSEISLSEVVRKFKSYTTHLYIDGVNNKGWQRFHSKLWQRNYYEHIIRNQRSYDFIANYINMNPLRWRMDNINPSHDMKCDEIMKHVKSLE